MMDAGLFPALLVSAAAIGSVHALAPDHWLPFVALSRARGWGWRRTAALTAVCGLGHVATTALLGAAAVVLGAAVASKIGGDLEGMVPALLVVFGLVYAGWGLRRAARARLHRHPGGSGVVDRLLSRFAVGGLFVLFCLDVCVALLPLVLAGAALGPERAGAVVIIYATATLATMSFLVLAGRANVGGVRVPSLERYSDTLAGLLIALSGLMGPGLGI